MSGHVCQWPGRCRCLRKVGVWADWEAAATVEVAAKVAPVSLAVEKAAPMVGEAWVAEAWVESKTCSVP